MIADPRFLKTPGETHGDFVVTKCLLLTELNCILRELVHTPTGAQVMHIANDDPENLFCLSFKTYPSSSNGVAHILEHTVLCGSKRFPVKDPFFAMSRRSLNTFMNALTGADFTCYPASSQVEKDFYNLLDVYLDAVFHPELKLLSFLQEGHRLEFSVPTDPHTPLQFKGIVFNEMKGSLASLDARLWHTLMSTLVPDLPYAYNSGGDPKEIPNLSYPELISFHETFYHPSRCLFFFYGNLPLKQHLDFISQKALKNVPKAFPLPPIPKQTRFTAPVYKETFYPTSEKEDLAHRTVVVFGYLTAPLVDQEEVLALSVLDSVLMETDASLLKRPLLQSKLCVQADSYIDIEMSEVPFAIVCKGCQKENVEAIESKINSALQKIVEQGVPSHILDAAIHQLEFERMEITGDQSPFGLTLFMRSGLAKQHNCKPENALLVHSLFESLLEKVKDPDYLPGLIKKHLLDNPHRVRLILNPNPNLTSEELADELQKLKHIQAELTEKSTSDILNQTEQLAKYHLQTEEQSIDCLPKVALEDIPPIVRDFPLKHSTQGALEIFHHDCFTNHILYADLVFDLPYIQDEDLPYVHLLTTLLPEIGSGDRSYSDNLEYIQAHTGGIGAITSLHVQAKDPKLARPCFNLKGKSLSRKADKLFILMKETLLQPRFDEADRIEELILQLRNSLVHRINRQAMRYAVHLSVSGFSPAAHIHEAWYGLRYFKAIEQLSKNLSQNLPKIIDKLLSLKQQLFTFHQPHLILSCSKERFQELEKENFFGISDLPAPAQFTPWNMDFAPTPLASQGRLISSQVAFTSEAYKTVSYFHPHAPALVIASFLFENKILHHHIREQGGAYGCGATFSTSLGHFYFHSYRDPHIASTLSTFKLAASAIAAGHFSLEDLNEAKLGIIQQLDVPISPGSRAMTAYSWLRDGKTKEMRQQFRDRLLALTPKDIQNVVEVELLPKIDQGVTVSLAGKELLERANEHLTLKDKALPILPL